MTGEFSHVAQTQTNRAHRVAGYKSQVSGTKRMTMDFGIALPSMLDSWKTVNRAEELG